MKKTKQFKNEYRKFLVERLSYFRASANMSARDLSLRMGKSEGYIAKFEMGEVNMPSEVLLDALAVLKVSPQKFFSKNPQSFDEDNQIFNNLNTLTQSRKKLVVELIDTLKMD